MKRENSQNAPYAVYLQYISHIDSYCQSYHAIPNSTHANAHLVGAVLRVLFCATAAANSVAFIAPCCSVATHIRYRSRIIPDDARHSRRRMNYRKMNDTVSNDMIYLKRSDNSSCSDNMTTTKTITKLIMIDKNDNRSLIPCH